MRRFAAANTRESLATPHRLAARNDRRVVLREVVPGLDLCSRRQNGLDRAGSPRESGHVGIFFPAKSVQLQYLPGYAVTPVFPESAENFRSSLQSSR